MRADAGAIAELINACSVAEGGAPDFTAAQLVDGWGDRNLATDAWVAASPDRAIVGYEEIEFADAPAPAQLDGYVHPARKGRGIGTTLLRLAEARARQAGAARLRATIESVNHAARQLFAAEGYAPVRHHWRMQIALDAPFGAPAWPSGVAVRTFVPEQDARATHALIEAAFADHWGHVPVAFEDWRRALHHADFDPTLWFLAVHDEQLVGTALCFDRAEHGGWIRNVGVRADWRRRGLGMALLRHAFRALRERGLLSAGLSVDSQSLTGATRLYERAGMHVVERYDTCEKTLDA
jgi:mycothiol synthase